MKQTFIIYKEQYNVPILDIREISQITKLKGDLGCVPLDVSFLVFTM